MPTLADLGEFEVIRRLDAVRPRGADVVLGSGDDAAVLQPDARRELVVTTDTFVEGRHYIPEWCGPELAGRRLAVANVSDIAAMGARPRWAVRSAGVPPTRDIEELVAFEAGLAGQLADDGAHIVGGNLSSTANESWFTLTLIGDVPAGRALKRSGARAGDVVCVTGYPGRAGAGYRLVRTLGDGARGPKWRPLVDAWVKPESRVGLAQALAERGLVSAATDISDGLAADLGHMCDASGAGALLDLDAWPLDESLSEAASELGVPVLDLLFAPSDDYELVLAVPGDSAGTVRAVADEAGVPVAFLGGFTDDVEGVVRHDAGGRRAIDSAGFDHFGA